VMHRKNNAHRDIQTDNITITIPDMGIRFSLKLVDFDRLKEIPSHNDKKQSFAADFMDIAQALVILLLRVSCDVDDIVEFKSRLYTI